MRSPSSTQWTPNKKSSQPLFLLSFHARGFVLVGKIIIIIITTTTLICTKRFNSPAPFKNLEEVVWHFERKPRNQFSVSAMLTAQSWYGALTLLCCITVCQIVTARIVRHTQLFLYFLILKPPSGSRLPRVNNNNNNNSNWISIEPYGRNVRRRTVVARSDYSRTAVERQYNRSRIVVVTTALPVWHQHAGWSRTGSTHWLGVCGWGMICETANIYQGSS